MRLLVDDEIYNVNAVWLGPPRKTLPWRARYVATAVGAVVFVVLQTVEPRLGIGMEFLRPGLQPARHDRSDTADLVSRLPRPPDRAAHERVNRVRAPLAHPRLVLRSSLRPLTAVP